MSWSLGQLIWGSDRDRGLFICPDGTCVPNPEPGERQPERNVAPDMLMTASTIQPPAGAEGLSAR